MVRRILMALVVGGLFYSGHVHSQEVEKKDIAKYGEWTVTLNYQDASNPTCQIWAPALSSGVDYGGMITIWRDYKAKKEWSNRINIEVMIFDIKKNALAKLGNKLKPQFGNNGGVVSGILRDTQGSLLFLSEKNDFKKLIDSANEIFMATTADRFGNEIALAAPLYGIHEACIKCGLLE